METLKLLCYLVYATAILPFGCGIVLWVTADRMRAQYFLAVALLLTSLFFWRAIFWNGTVFPLYGIVFGVRSTLSGALLAMLFTLFPVEFILPGWLTLRHTLKYLLPFLLCVMVYVLSLLSGVEYRVLVSLSEAVRYAEEFNVWVRFIFFAVSFGYALMIFWIPYRVGQFMKLGKWIRCYSSGSLGITAVYAGVVLTGNVLGIYIYMLYLLVFSLVVTGRMVWVRYRNHRPVSRFREKALFKD